MFIRFQIYIFRRNSIFIEYISSIIDTLFVLFINLFSQSIIYNTHYIKLAFNTSPIYRYKNSDKQIIKIEFTSFNKTIYKKIFIKHKKLFDKYQFSTRYLTVKQTITYFKNSGFIKNIKLNFIKIHNINYILFNIYINPLLKKVTIVNYKKLQIPSSILINLFRKQIGLPKNYIKINDSINKICLWYKQKGFDSIKIQIIENKNLENIYLEIHEGQIINNILICQNRENINKKIRYKIEKIIQQELEILPGHILNTKKIESGIQYLKDIQIIGDCKYKVIERKSGLKLIIQYKILKNKNFNFYMKIVNLNENLTSHNYIFNSILNHLIINKYYLCFDKIRKVFLEKISHIPLNTSLIYQIYNKARLNSYLNFKYSSFYFDYYNYPKRFIYDIKVMKKVPHIDIFIIYPNVININNFMTSFTLNLKYKLISSKSLYHLQPKNILSLSNKKYNFIFQLKGIQILVKHNLHNEICLQEKITKIEYTIIKHYINIKNLIPEFIFKDMDNKKQYILTTLYNFIKYRMIGVDIYIKYYKLYIYNYIKLGTSFIIELTSLICLPFSKLQTINFIQQSCEQLYVQYYQKFIIPQFIPYIKKHENIFVLFSELYGFINPSYHIPFIQKNEYNSTQNNIYIKSTLYNKYRKFSIASYLHHLEYNISISQNVSIYTFFNYINSLYKNSNIKYYSLINIYNYNYEINIGYGIQFNLHTKNIPPLRIEYGINNRQEKFIQLRAYSQDNNYSL